MARARLTSWFSILEMILMFLPASPRVSRMKLMSAADYGWQMRFKHVVISSERRGTW